MTNVSSIREQLESEDNLAKVQALRTKIMREERMESFKEKWLSKLQERYSVRYYELAEKFSIDTGQRMFGVIDYFPKSNGVLIRKGNKWEKPGLTWIIGNLLKKNENNSNFANG